MFHLETLSALSNALAVYTQSHMIFLYSRPNLELFREKQSLLVGKRKQALNPNGLHEYQSPMMYFHLVNQYTSVEFNVVILNGYSSTAINTMATASLNGRN